MATDSKFVDIGRSITDQNQFQLRKSAFDKLLFEKGRNVIHEKALVCPCKDKSGNAQSTCLNCYGSGWFFVNARNTRMIITRVEAKYNLLPWSEELQGTINVTASELDQLSYMDRITLSDGKSIYAEVVQSRKQSNKLFAFLAYRIKSIIYIGCFIETAQPIRQLKLGIDYTIQEQSITIINPEIVALHEPNYPLSITVRYEHSPTFHVQEMLRDTMQSYEGFNENEKVKDFPVQGVARRAHYLLDQKHYNGQSPLNNDYDESNLSC